MEKEFNPAEFKEIAIYLKNNGNDISNVSLECINRVIAGRLYYSIFLILRELVTEELSNYRHSEKIDNFIDTLLVGSVHTTLLNFIEKIKDGLNREDELNMTIRQICNSLEILKGHRVSADYELSIPTPVKIKKNKDEIIIAKLERKYNIIFKSLDKLKEFLKDNKTIVLNILNNL
jgi:hypothetical protein